MRGKVTDSDLAAVAFRITPAYAGKSSVVFSESLNIEDHPRLCGEKDLLPWFTDPPLGSPPPMRGKGLLRYGNVDVHGITPAYAGKRKIPQIVASKCRDHPRLCGEKVDSTFSLLIVRGSPPPMRGKAIRKYWELGTPRITPAYAGKSFQKLLHNPLQQDHPRLCGEKCTSSAMSRIKSGSPPPMRGKDAEPKGTDQKFRITPAYAGKSR